MCWCLSVLPAGLEPAPQRIERQIQYFQRHFLLLIFDLPTTYCKRGKTLNVTMTALLDEVRLFVHGPTIYCSKDDCGPNNIQHPCC